MLEVGNHSREVDETTLAILTNKDLTAIDQVPLGIQGFRIYENPFFEIWLKPLQNGSKAIRFFNRGMQLIQYNIDWEKLLCLIRDYSVNEVWKI